MHHIEWFGRVKQVCADVGIEPSLPRVCGCQCHRSNALAQTPSEYYRRNLPIPVLDHLLSELDTRFTTHQQTALQGLYLIPSVLVSKSVYEISPKICQLGQMYECDLPHSSSLLSELHCWHMKWKQQEKEHRQASLPTSPFLSLPHASAMFSNIKVLLLILCTLPVTSCSAEGSFSSLKWITIALRSKMGNDRLTSLALLHVHRDIDVSVSDIVEEFPRRHPRRLQLADIFAN